MNTTPDLSRVTWEKSSYSNGGGGACVEFTRSLSTQHLVPVRDSKNPEGPALVFDTTAWGTFVQAVANGEFGGV
jgi:Domain of unknown function (DUF397)